MTIIPALSALCSERVISFMINYNIEISCSTFDNGSSVVNNTFSDSAKADAELLAQLRELQTSLEKTEPMIASVVAELQNAIRIQNKSKISESIKQLSTGFAASFLANVAGPMVLAYLGIGA